jgi:hypothetical protein
MYQQGMAFGAAEAFNAMLFPEMNPVNRQFLEQQIQSVLPMFVNGGQEFFDRSMQYFHHYNGEEALRFARNVVQRQAETIEQPRIMEYTTNEQFQRATPLMQRFVMANPRLRPLYVQQRIDGYSESYNDLDPGQSGWQQYDYRRAVEGLLQFDEEDETGAWHMEQFCGDELREGDRELILEEQRDIMRSWTNYDLLQALTKDDLTSSSGGQL